MLVVRALSWRAAYRGILPDSALARITERWNRSIPRWTWVAEREGILVAYCIADIEPPIVRIQELYVIPELWRGGLGTQLMDTVLAEAENRAAEVATLEVLEKNRPGIAFYEKRGFRHVKNGDRQIRVDGQPLVTREYRRTI